MEISRESTENVEIQVEKGRMFNSSTSQVRLKRTKPKKNFKCCKETIRFLFSHIGLVLLFLAFVFSGGFLFQLLERHAAIQKCELGQNLDRSMIRKYGRNLLNLVWLNLTSDERDFLIDTVANKTKLSNLSSHEYLYYHSHEGFQEFDKLVNEFKDKVIDVYFTHGYHGQDCVLDTSWIIESSILFSISVLTTIGYGHVTPITWEGQVVCMCFSMVGIPLFFLCMANISVALGDLFRTIYSNLIDYIFEKFCFSASKQLNENGEENLESFYLNEHEVDGGGGGGGEGVGGGDGVGKAYKKFKSNKVENEEDQEIVKKTYEFVIKAFDLEDVYYPERLHYRLKEDRVSVPLVIAILIIFIYICIGSFLFKNLEGWTLVQASYFSFITMATIGFGDLVPGINHINVNGGKKAGENLLIAGIYLFFGIAILGMCFDLMQEELIIKYSKLRAMFIGRLDENGIGKSIENLIIFNSKGLKRRSIKLNNMKSNDARVLNIERISERDIRVLDDKKHERAAGSRTI